MWQQLTTSAGGHPRPGTISQANSTAASTDIDLIQNVSKLLSYYHFAEPATALPQALRQAQLSASDAHSQAQKDARNGSSASAKSRVVKKPADDAAKALQAAGRKILILCTPWPLWTISGSWIVGGSGASAARQISANDEAGKEVLSYVPRPLMTDFFSKAGQNLVSPCFSIC